MLSRVRDECDARASEDLLQRLDARRGLDDVRRDQADEVAAVWTRRVVAGGFVGFIGLLAQWRVADRWHLRGQTDVATARADLGESGLIEDRDRELACRRVELTDVEDRLLVRGRPHCVPQRSLLVPAVARSGGVVEWRVADLQDARLVVRFPQ